MLMVLLYGLATFMETALGVWIFSKMFQKRNNIYKKQIRCEWLLLILIMLSVYTFSRAYLSEIIKIKFFIIPVYCLMLLVQVLYYKENFKIVSLSIIKGFLFFCIIILLTWQYWTAYVSAIISLLGNIYVPFFFYTFYKCTFVQAYLWQFIFLANLGLLKTIYIVYDGIFGNKMLQDFIIYQRYHTYSGIGYLMAIYVILFFIIKYFPLESLLSSLLHKYKMKIFSVTVVEWGLWLALINLGSDGLDSKDLAVTLILVLGIMIAFFLLFAKYFEKANDTERRLLDVRNEAVEEQYRELRDAYERHRCLVHDEKHMILFLRECLENGEVREAKKFLENYQNEIIISGRNSWTGISTLDFMLNIKKRKMDEFNIDFSFDSRIESIPMEDADFVVLLGNLFDNAIEAAEKCQIGDREIKLSVKNTNEILIIRMKNTSDALPKKRNNRFLTDKKEKYKHGWGIESVKHIVSKYDGELSFRYDSNFFEVSVIISE